MIAFIFTSQVSDLLALIISSESRLSNIGCLSSHKKQYWIDIDGDDDKAMTNSLIL